MAQLTKSNNGISGDAGTLTHKYDDLVRLTKPASPSTVNRAYRYDIDRCVTKIQ
ncbi:MAG TPA: hypothetical protein VM492_03065 [Sumerlaeia bacterium]|nr:hypothetical protein [Sumerlaeia bacterium]